jgi:hypothetical protein
MYWEWGKLSFVETQDFRPEHSEGSLLFLTALLPFYIRVWYAIQDGGLRSLSIMHGKTGDTPP